MMHTESNNSEAYVAKYWPTSLHSPGVPLPRSSCKNGAQVQAGADLVSVRAHHRGVRRQAEQSDPLHFQRDLNLSVHTRHRRLEPSSGRSTPLHHTDVSSASLQPPSS